MSEIFLMGTNGQLYLYEDHIEIERNGFAARVTHRKEKITSIAYEEIAGVKMHPGCFLSAATYTSRGRTAMMIPD